MEEKFSKFRTEIVAEVHILKESHVDLVKLVTLHDDYPPSDATEKITSSYNSKVGQDASVKTVGRTARNQFALVPQI